MKDFELFNKIRSANYTRTGKNCDWYIEFNEESNTIYLLFQESVGWDWFYNFLAWPIPVRPYKGMKKKWLAHYGLIRVYRSARDTIIQAVKDKYKEGMKIIVGGFSHGGGLAQLAAEDICFQLDYKPEVVIFGSMRPFMGKKSLQHAMECYDMNTSRSYQNGTDIVPYLPPYGKTLPFKHIGEKFNIFKIFIAGKYHQGYGEEKLY